jgi:predicted dehydrogenase (TIGR03970 family)
VLAAEADVVIVGGGTAGCVLAARLSENPDRSVLLLEAGRDLTSVADLPPVLQGHPPLSVQTLPDTWRYDVELVHSPSRRMSQFRGRVLGGSSSINGSLFIRGVPEDYDRWESPLWTFSQVLPYLRTLETDLDFHDEYHGSAGPVHVSRALDQNLSPTQQEFYAAAIRAGIAEKRDMNHPFGDGIGHVPMTRTSRSTALTYLAPARRRPNITVCTETTVLRIVFDGRRAVGVDVAVGQDRRVIRAHEVILSCGTFGSAQLLLASGVGPADQLRSAGITCVADRPGVGSNLRCHPMLTLRFPTPASARAQLASDPEAPRLVLVHSEAERNNLMLFPRRAGDDLAIMVTLRLPAGHGALRLHTADQGGSLDIAYGYLEPTDLTHLKAGLELATSLARAMGASAEPPSDGWIQAHLETADHACGTCKLGPATDPLAVVDDMCRVHAVEGLRVVDLSIVPRSVRAGPYPTVVMLAERAADLIGSR